jgi:hypothetical protein
MDLRYVATSLTEGSSEHIFDTLYCTRGQAENLIKLHKTQLASDRTLSLSRPAQASLTLWPAGLLNRPRRTLSRGFSPTGYPAKPLLSYQTYRQLSGWNLPPLVLRAVGAH